MKNSIWIIVAVAVFFALLVAVCIPKFTTIDVEAAKDKIAIGMTQQQVIDILGEPSSPARSYPNTASGRTETVMYYWDSKDDNKKLRVVLSDGLVYWIVVQESSD